MNINDYKIDENAIAIIGMALRFPGAENIDTFWNNLKNGTESITRFKEKELIAAGESLERINRQDYVNACGWVDGIDLFDADFFGYSPGEVRLLDPQQRLFLEGAWEALEQAGYNVDTCQATIGVYAGVGMNYYFHELLNRMDSDDTAERFQMIIANGSDFVSTRIAYKLNLKGPAVNVQTACSTSLVAVHLACQSLLMGECDMALAGGVSFQSLQQKGYLYQSGMIASPDGHCRAFDEKGQGTVVSNGMGVVVLKPLKNAVEDGDAIYAVIKGSAINNDGADKIGFTAPSIEGQSKVIAEALAIADVMPQTISYVEAHGTGTVLGDPIELTALSKAYSAYTNEKQYCAIGSLKTNVGHMDIAAGVGGLIKTALALKYGYIPPSLHFETPNPKLNMENSPFYVNTLLKDWTINDWPRRAGVSAFGIGGTNAHLILEEAPILHFSESARPWQLLLISAKTEMALGSATQNLQQYLKTHPDLPLSDVAYTLQVGRKNFNYRKIFVVKDIPDAIEMLTDENQGLISYNVNNEKPAVTFLFPGGGSEYVNMAKEVYAYEPVFKEQLDLCADLLLPILQADIRKILYPTEALLEKAQQHFNDASYTHPIIFSVEYALAQLFISWGIKPTAMIGHSLGEYAAACLSGVLSLKDALMMVAKRASLIQNHAPGSVLAVLTSENEVSPLLTEGVSIAAINTASTCVVSGSTESIHYFKEKLEMHNIVYKNLYIYVAAHSPLLDGVLEEYKATSAQITLHSPKIPYISSQTGDWVQAQEVADPSYWAAQLRQPVQFEKGLQKIIKHPNQILLEIGGGRALSTFSKESILSRKDQIAIPTLPSGGDPTPSLYYLYKALGMVWSAGAPIDWRAFHHREKRQRVPLPTYPFERKRYWLNTNQTPRKISSVQEEYSFSVNEPESVYEVKRDINTNDNHRQLGVKYIAPSNELQKQIVDIWQNQLGIIPIGVHDDFFEMGGSSLMAIQLVNKLNNILRISLSPSYLIENPTIARLAHAIASIAQNDFKYDTEAYKDILVCLQRGNPKKTPIFLIHAIGGTVYSYRALVQAIDEDIPVYGLQARGMDGKQKPLNDFKAMAKLYTDAICFIQPEGSYQLVGHSMGGIIAYEIAQRLQELNKKLHLLAMIDTALCDDFGPVVNEAAFISYLLDQQLNIPFQVSLEDLRNRDTEEQIAYYLLKIQDEAQLNFNPSEFEILLNMYKIGMNMMLKYVPKKEFSGEVIQFKPKEKSVFNTSNPEATWKHWIRNWESYEVAGNHITMINAPNVLEIAKILHSKIYNYELILENE